jgi:hypothetical protein
MPNDQRLRDTWVQAAEAIHEHRSNHGIHSHENPNLPNMPTSLRALLRRSRDQLGVREPDAGLDLGH